MKETQALHGKTEYESKVCMEGNCIRDLFATSFCLSSCKQEDCMGERTLIYRRDIVALIQRVGVGVSVGSSASFHVYVNKGLYRQHFYFLCQLVGFFPPKLNILWSM